MTLERNRGFIIAGSIGCACLILTPLVLALLSQRHIGTSFGQIYFGVIMEPLAIVSFALLVGFGIMPRLWTKYFSGEFVNYPLTNYDRAARLRAERKFRSLGLLIDDPIVELSDRGEE
jgi:hypothetical protein